MVVNLACLDLEDFYCWFQIFFLASYHWYLEFQLTFISWNCFVDDAIGSFEVANLFPLHLYVRTW